MDAEMGWYPGKEWDISEAKGGTKDVFLFGMMAGTGVESGVWFGVYRDRPGSNQVHCGVSFYAEKDCQGGVSERGVSWAGAKAEVR